MYWYEEHTKLDEYRGNGVEKSKGEKKNMACLGAVAKVVFATKVKRSSHTFVYIIRIIKLVEIFSYCYWNIRWCCQGSSVIV